MKVRKMNKKITQGYLTDKKMEKINNQIKFTSRKFLTLLKGRGILAYIQ